MNSVIAESLHRLTDLGFIVVLVYSGAGEIAAVFPNGQITDFIVYIETNELQSLRKDYDAGTLTIADAKTYADTYSRVSFLLRNARRDGRYIHEDFVDEVKQYRKK